MILINSFWIFLIYLCLAQIVLSNLNSGFFTKFYYNEQDVADPEWFEKKQTINSDSLISCGGILISKSWFKLFPFPYFIFKDNEICEIGFIHPLLANRIFNGDNDESNTVLNIYLMTNSKIELENILIINYPDTTEVIDLRNNKSCLSGLPQPNEVIRGQIGLTYRNDYYFCNAFTTKSDHEKCWILDQTTKTWNFKSGVKLDSRTAPKVLPTINDEYFIFGDLVNSYGNNAPHRLIYGNTALFSKGMFHSGPDIKPSSLAIDRDYLLGACGVSYKGITGYIGKMAGDVGDKLFQIDLRNLSKPWIQLPDDNGQPENVFRGNCGWIHNEKGEVEIVFTAGTDFNAIPQKYYTRTRIFNVDQQIWTTAPDFPEQRWDGRSIQYDGFFIVTSGAFIPGVEKVENYMFDYRKRWIPMASLIVGTSIHGFLKVPASQFSCPS